MCAGRYLPSSHWTCFVDGLATWILNGSTSRRPTMRSRLDPRLLIVPPPNTPAFTTTRVLVARSSLCLSESQTSRSATNHTEGSTARRVQFVPRTTWL